MEPAFLLSLGVALLVLGAVVWLARRIEHARDTADARTAHIAEAAERLMHAQSELSGRLSAMSESQALVQQQLNEKFQAHERVLTRTLEERLADVSRRVGEGLEKQSTKTSETMHDLRERLAVIDSAQKNITELSTQVVGLQDILSNKQARGAFGEVQLNDLVTGCLPPSAYSFQGTLSNGKRADCVLELPNPPGKIVIDAKFPLESYHQLRQAPDDAAAKAAARAFGTDVLTHVRAIAEKYIVPGETAESALMFLPSEAVYAELHANFSDVVEKSFRAKVWIVSPTTLMATLNTVRAVLKDARMREQAGVIQKEVERLLDDVTRLDKRVGNLSSHFGQAQKDIREIEISTGKIASRGERIKELELAEAEEDPQASLKPGPRGDLLE